MKYETLQASISEAKRFIKRGIALSKVHEEETVTDTLLDHPKEQGAVRRASMDLTRCLSDLRAGR